MKTVGNVSIQEQSGATLAVNEFGLDVLSRTFYGSETFLSAFLATLRGRRDSTFTQLICTDYNVTFGEGGIVQIGATFKGLIDGNPRPVRFDSSTALQSMQANHTWTESGVSNTASITVDYYAPTVSYSYSQNTEPLSPQHQSAAVNFFNRLSLKPIPFNPRPRVGQLGNFENGRFTLLNTKDYCTQFATQKEGEWWEVQETWSRFLYGFTHLYP